MPVLSVEAYRLKVELGVLVESKEAAAKAFNAGKEELVKESKDLKRKAEEIKASLDLVMCKDDKLQSKS